MFFVQIKAQVCVTDIVLHGLSPPFFVLIDSAGRTGVVGTALLWDKHTKSGGKRHGGEIELELRKNKLFIDK